MVQRFSSNLARIEAAARDRDGDRLEWSLSEEPPGKAVPADGVVTFTPDGCRSDMSDVAAA